MRILFVGAFPPPVHGMAASNQNLLERFQAEGWKVDKLDTSPVTLQRDILSRLSRWRKWGSVWSRLTERRDAILYLTLAGGWGQIYDLITILLGRLKRFRIVLHHRSFAYLDKKFFLTAMLVRLAGRNALHVVLCDEMGAFLRRRYGAHLSVFTLSNRIFFTQEGHNRSDARLRNVGFLSNITREKGGDALLELAQALRQKGLPLRVCLAGPCLDDRLQEAILQASGENVFWKGPLYGEEKTKFFQEVDAFIFPTRYKNEAEPRVIWEALSASLPIIAFRRGCISHQAGDAAVLIDPDADFTAAALKTLETWLHNEEEYQAAVERARLRYRVTMEESLRQWKTFLALLSA